MSDETQNKPDAIQVAVPEAVRNSPVKSRARAAFVEWLATPETLRQPKTARSFAEENQISERTLYRWRNSDEIQKRVRQLVNSSARARYGDVVNAIVDTAVGGDVGAQKLYLQQFIPESRKEDPQGQFNQTITFNYGGKVAEPLRVGIFNGKVGPRPALQSPSREDANG
jgi:hypothetical protein